MLEPVQCGGGPLRLLPCLSTPVDTQGDTRPLRCWKRRFRPSSVRTPAPKTVEGKLKHLETENRFSTGSFLPVMEPLGQNVYI